MSTKKNENSTRTNNPASGRDRASAPQKEEMGAAAKQQRFVKIVAIAVVGGLVLSMVVPALASLI